MAQSYNGWEGIPVNDSRLETIEVAGIRMRVRRGNVARVLEYVAQRFHDSVEPINKGPLDDWGWAYRAVRGGSSLSNHASGTAIDLNATKHPFRTNARDNMTAGQIAACRSIVNYCTIGGAPVVRWLETSDPMHFEINYIARGGSPYNVDRLAEKIAGGIPTVPPLVDRSPIGGVAKRVPRKSVDVPTRIVQEIVGSKVDGKRGPRTIADIKSFQRWFGVNEDGKFGPVTAERYLLSHGNLFKGQRGTDIKLIQWIGSVHADGIFGNGTENAVRGMQAWAGLSQDGVVGELTKRAITR